MSTFYKKPSLGFTCWGCNFDSLIELKYAISIKKDFEFLHCVVPIFFHPGTLKTSDRYRDGYRRYTPDFLIRHKVTREAYWVEIKPQGFSDHAQLALRSTIANDYIRRKGFDWRFKVVYGNEIVLDKTGARLFWKCCTLTLGTGDLPKGFGLHALSRQLAVKPPAENLTAFIMFGTAGKQKNNFTPKI